MKKTCVFDETTEAEKARNYNFRLKFLPGAYQSRISTGIYGESWETGYARRKVKFTHS